ncbi:MAG: hypothetical protein AB1306_07630 [Nitrospirota bacterium]
MRNIKNRIDKIERVTEAKSNFSDGVIYMLKDGSFECDGQIYDKEEDLPIKSDSDLGWVFLPKRKIDGEPDGE